MLSKYTACKLLWWKSFESENETKVHSHVSISIEVDIDCVNNIYV